MADEAETNITRPQRRTSKKHICLENGCGKIFSRKEHLRRHSLNHKKAQVWNCETCHVNFVRRDLWRRHWRVRHHAEPPWEDAATPILTAGALEPPGHETAETNSVQSHYRSDTADTPIATSGRELSNVASTFNMSTNLVETRTSEALDPHEVDIAEDINEEVMDQHGYNLDLGWQDWIGDVQLDFQPDANVDLSWLFGGDLHDEHQPNDFGRSPVHADLRHSIEGSPNASPRKAPLEESALSEIGQVAILDQPTCGFRVCHALSSQSRRELLAMLGMEVIDIEPNLLALPSLRHGVHLFNRFLSKEFPILHHQVFCPPDQQRKILEDSFELHSPPELMWAVISFGWSILDAQKYTAYRAAAKKIQAILIRKIITHQNLKLSSPLWLIQTLFLCLAFARYHGSREDYGFATVFQGVLLDLVRRIDLGDPSYPDSASINGEENFLFQWFGWIRRQTMIRIIFQAFIMDVQQAYLHGGDVSLSPFSLRSRLPDSDDAWFAPTLEKWVQVHKSLPTETPEFLSILKTFWNTSVIKPTPYTFPRGCKVLMYGILAIAYDLRRRDDNSFSAKLLYSLESVGTKVHKSFEKWLQWWEQTYNHPQMESIHLWRNCACVFRLGHTLYEVGAHEWQIIAGVDTIDGKRIKAAEYMRAKRKVKAWVKQDRAATGLALAAMIVKEKLHVGNKSMAHCTHCQWSLYLAGLICWGFGFVSPEVETHQPPRDFRQARQECEEYLAAATSTSGLPGQNMINKTTGLLLVLIDVFNRVDEGEGLTEESLKSLSRLVRPNHA